MAQTLVDRLIGRVEATLRARLRQVVSDAEREAKAQPRKLNSRMVAKAGRAGKRRRRKVDMHCRVEGCRNLSKGPRYGFICEEHRKKLSKKAQQAAREAWKAKQAA